MSEIEQLIKNMASRYGQAMDHEDVTKCGQCWKEKIRSEVAKEFLDAGKFDVEHLSQLFQEVDQRWQQTELYLRVKEMLEDGKTIEEVDVELQKEGIEI